MMFPKWPEKYFYLLIGAFNILWLYILLSPVQSLPRVISVIVTTAALGYAIHIRAWWLGYNEAKELWASKPNTDNT